MLPLAHCSTLFLAVSAGLQFLDPGEAEEAQYEMDRTTVPGPRGHRCVCGGEPQEARGDARQGARVSARVRREGGSGLIPGVASAIGTRQ